MIAVTLICVALGVWAVRVEYLRRCAVFHKQQAQRYAKQIGFQRIGDIHFTEISCSTPARQRKTSKLGGITLGLGKILSERKNGPGCLLKT
jgi:hypothetical protein